MSHLIKLAFWFIFMSLDMLSRLHRDDFLYTARIYLAGAGLMQAEAGLLLAFKGRVDGAIYLLLLAGGHGWFNAPWFLGQGWFM